MLEYTVKMTEEDYLKFNYHNMENSKIGKNSLLYIRILGPVLFLIATLIFTPKNPFSIILSLIIWVAISALWIIFSKKLLLSNLKSSIKQLKKDGKLPYSADSKIVFTEDDVHEYCIENETITKYPMFQKIYLTDNGIYMYINASQAIIFPNSCFNSSDEKNELIEFLKGKIAPDKFA